MRGPGRVLQDSRSKQTIYCRSVRNRAERSHHLAIGTAQDETEVRSAWEEGMMGLSDAAPWMLDDVLPRGQNASLHSGSSRLGEPLGANRTK